jgi:hypothetical protein
LKRLLIAACLLCTPALAANLAGGAWTILDYADTQCHPAGELVPKTPTPWLFNKYIRSEGLAATITEHKCGDQKLDDRLPLCHCGAAADLGPHYHFERKLWGLARRAT